MDSPAARAVRRARPSYEWHPAELGGNQQTRVWRLEGSHPLYVKIAETHDDAELDGGPLEEARRLHWLTRQNVPCPEVVDAGEVDGEAFLVTRQAPGRPAAADWPRRQRMPVVDAYADFARQLHRLPVEDCPFDRTLKQTVPAAQERAALGEIDAAELDSSRRGWSSTQLIVELVTAARRVRREEPTVCHGDYCLPNVLVDPENLTVTALLDVGRLGVADRYADLALATRSLADSRLNPQYGKAYADRFWHRYGETPVDGDRVELYRMLDEFF